jgi:hypothetical protein
MTNRFQTLLSKFNLRRYNKALEYKYPENMRAHELDEGRDLHSVTLELNLSNSSIRS